MSERVPAKEITNEAPKHVSSVMKISEWKQQMMETMAMDDDLAKLLYYDSSDALSRPNLTEEQKYELVTEGEEKRRIYPTRYKPGVVMDQQSFIGMAISNFSFPEIHYHVDSDFVMGYLYFFILVDNKIMDIDEGQRQDQILARIYDLFSDSRRYGIGTVKIGQLSELWEQNNKFGGYQLMMRVYDFK